MAIVAVCSGTVYAQKNIEMVIPFPAGGPTDFIARTLAKEITARNPGINVTAINKVGADGIIATQYFLEKPTDKILMVTTGTSLYLKLTNPSVPYDPFTELDIIGPYITTSAGVIVKGDKFANWNDFVKYAQKNPVSCSASSATMAFFGRYLNDTYKLKIQIIPYNGVAPAMRDFLGGHTECGIEAVTVAKTYPGARIIALGAHDYSNNYPDIPVVSKDYEFISFMGMSIGRVDDNTKKQIQQTLVDLSRNHEFMQGLNAKGWSIRKPNLNYSQQLIKEYDYLRALEKRSKKQ